MASAHVDPLQTLQAALHQPADSREQAELLAALRESLEARPQPLPVICTTLFSTLLSAGDTLLKRWVLDLVHFGISRAMLPPEARTQLAYQSLDVLTGLLHDPSPRIVKVAVEAFCGIYSLLFLFMCQNRSARQQWEALSQAKARILEFVWTPHPVHAGIRLAAVKFMQRVILVQTRGVADPRLQNKNDPNLSMCPVDHPFIPIQALEAEGTRLLETVLRLLYTNTNPDIITAILNSWANFVKFRPTHIQLVVTSLTSWSPSALAGQSYTAIKSVEKAVRILLVHISRMGNNVVPYLPEINRALTDQAARMDRAAAEEKARKAAMKRPAPVVAPGEPSDAKRQRLDNTSTSAPAAFDFSAIPATLVTELIVANLQAFSEAELQALVRAYRQPSTSASSLQATPPPAPVVAPTQNGATRKGAPPREPAADRARRAEEAAAAAAAAVAATESDKPKGKEREAEKKEKDDQALDPLKMDIDDDVEEEAPAVPPEEPALEDDVVTAGDVKTLMSLDLKVPPPEALSVGEKDALIESSIARIRSSAGDVITSDGGGIELWMLLVVRMVTRGADPGSAERKGKMKMEDGTDDAEDDGEGRRFEEQDRLRGMLYNYIMANFSGRTRLATAWMNEEWYNDQQRRNEEESWRQNYDTWLSQIVAAYLPGLRGKDRTFGRFLLDLPSVSPDVFQLLRELCVDPERIEVGFTTLRDFVNQRPTLRADAMTILLELTTHSEKTTRGAAILTLKRWVGDTQPMDSMVREFALQLLRRLQAGRKTVEADDEEDGQLPQEDLLQTPYLTDVLELPAEKGQVLQHVELLLALSTKAPEFLDELFAAYGEMDVSVQEAIQDLITQLVRTLGPNNAKLLTLLRTFPPGADTLAMRILNIFTENGRPPPQLTALVKSIVAERDLDARFLVPIVSELDKAEIVRYLPRLVGLLNGTPERKQIVRNVFNSIVASTQPGFASSNAPRAKQTESLAPKELMVLLHLSEKDIGLRSAIEAVSICFSMADVFRAEVLAAVMQQIVDEPVLPTLFLRTVIQAVNTYKTLVGFVATTLLSRLITKKIWQNPRLWEGFIRCAMVIQPHSFNALLQLPKDQLREIVEKQPGLKANLRDFVTKRAGGNRARTAAFLDIFGDDDANKAPAAPSPEPTQNGNITESPAPAPPAQATVA